MMDFVSSLFVDLLAVLGAVSLLFIFGSTIYSWIQISKAVLSKYFQPNEKHTLTSKYGQWAGE